MSDKRPNKKQLEDIFTQIQTRGRDASGYAMLDDKTLKVVKAPILAEKLIQKRTWRKLTKLPPIMIMHTRAATQGVIQVNSNNHPIEDENLVAVHNGIISNEDEFDIPNTVVDSLAILKSWHQNEGDVEKVFSSLQGGFAVGLLDTNHPNRLVLFRHTNPIEIMFDQHDLILYFASTTYAVHKAKVKYDKTVKGLPIKDRYQDIDFPNNSYMEFNTTDGLVKHIDELTIKPTIYNTYQSNYPTNSIHQHNNYNKGTRYLIESDYYGYGDDLDWGGNYLPASQEKVADSLFFEYYEPTTDEEYRTINDKLKNTDLIAIECPHCQRATLIKAKAERQTCNQCKVIITNSEGIQYAN